MLADMRHIARPRLLCFPSRDVDFAAAADAAMGQNPEVDQPAALQAALRPSYPRVLVQPSVLEGALRSPTWYVYRDGRFAWQD
jgi:hypothetical protein